MPNMPAARVPIAKAATKNVANRKTFWSHARYVLSDNPFTLVAVVLFAAFVLIAIAVYLHLTRNDVGPWPAILAATSFLGGINLFGIGLLGEYIARIYDEVKCRPVYVVDRVDDGE